MRPFFRKRSSPVAYAAVLVLILSLPAIIGYTGWLTRSEVYPALSWRYGAFPWIQREIFAEKADLDVAILGSSTMWTAIDPLAVRQELTSRLQRPANVVTLGWNYTGYDMLYFVASDLLAHRRCRTLVIGDELHSSNAPHVAAYKVYHEGDFPEAMQSLEWHARLRVYAGAVIGLPRQMLSRVRPNRVEDPTLKPQNPTVREVAGDSDDIADRKGAARIRRNMDGLSDFEPFKRGTLAQPDDLLRYEPATTAHFSSPESLSPYQLNFARALVDLCRRNHTKLVVLSVPVATARERPTISMRRGWEGLVGADVQFIGMSQRRLFEGFTQKEIEGLFYDPIHLNQNGQDVFTRLVAPALANLFPTPPGEQVR